MTALALLSSWYHDSHTATHESYQISCEEYAALSRRAEGRCDRCGVQDPRLEIDHDHNHAWGLRAVRGMVCNRCNKLVDAVERGKRATDELTIAYLANPFHRLMNRKRTPRRVRRVQQVSYRSPVLADSERLA